MLERTISEAILIFFFLFSEGEHLQFYYYMGTRGERATYKHVCA